MIIGNGGSRLRTTSKPNLEQRLLSVLRFANDFDFGEGLQRLLQYLAGYRLIVDADPLRLLMLHSVAGPQEKGRKRVLSGNRLSEFCRERPRAS